MEYYNRLRDLREDNNKNQKEIANIIGTSQSYYSEYELGKRQLPIAHLKTLCLYYQVSADYILGLPKGLKWPR
ncbi:MAG: helix-turn-helix transcriptional regulator [Oscillospiraceae bacterium]|nr:helix-turn-helix transcriptional regulator [Oscillospiraceae bacterium]